MLGALRRRGTHRERRASGWHIERSGDGLNDLGDDIDIQTAGIDLRLPAPRGRAGLVHRRLLPTPVRYGPW